MSEPIKVGDLVRVFRCCCARREALLGRIFTVSGFVDHSNGCSFCGYMGGEPWARASSPFATAESGSEGKGAPLSWLKRIPPLSEFEGEKNKEELAA